MYITITYKFLAKRILNLYCACINVSEICAKCLILVTMVMLKLNKVLRIIKGVARIFQREVLNSADAFSADKNSLPKTMFRYF